MYRASERFRNSGVTLIEILIVIGILMITSAIAMGAFKGMLSSKTTETEASRIVAELNEARSLTLSSKYARSYGVHFASLSVTSFQGTVYEVGSSTNVTTLLGPRVRVSSINLAGGGSDIVFQRLTGETAQSGTITLSLISNPSSSKTITVYATGLVEID